MDKAKTCLNCPDRFCGCHSQCDDYKQRVEKMHEIKEKRAAYMEEDAFFTELAMKRRRKK